MKKSFYALMFIFMGLCAGNRYLPSKIAFTIAEKDLIPEGITYSTSTKSFYLSSLNKKKIIQIDAETGVCRNIIGSEALGMAVLGLAVDDAKKCLWACAENLGGRSGKSTVAKFDLASGRLLHSYERLDTARFTVNDLALDTKGDVYYTNRANHSVFKIDAETGRVEMLLQDIEIEHPNGIAISPDNQYLYVASETKGIRVVNLKKRRLLQNDARINSKGIDGLKFYKHSLIGIQNGVPNSDEIKIVRYLLDPSLTRIAKHEIIDQDNPDFDTPTTFVIVNDTLFCLANSQLGNFTPEGIKDPSKLRNVKIIKYDLSALRK